MIVVSTTTEEERLSYLFQGTTSSYVASTDSLEQAVLTQSYTTQSLYTFYILGRHCCLWCKIDHADLKIPLSVRGRSPLRTLENLKQDHEEFLAKAHGDLKKAKEYFNVIGEVLFDIPLTNVRGYTLLSAVNGKHVYVRRCVYLDFTYPWGSLIGFGSFWRGHVMSLISH